MKLEKIHNFIKENNIGSGDFIYHTWRDVKNNENTGKIRILVLKSDRKARTEYICPHCQHYGYKEKEWKRPFNIHCDNCGKLIKVPKLKDQVKREMKK